MNQLFAKPLVILVGKTNVGKSTLFNRLVNRRFNIAHSTPGATRDCIIKDTDFMGQELALADSGGLESIEAGNPFQSLITERVHGFIYEKASLILFIVSAKDGLSAQDEEIASFLHHAGKPVLLVVNKVDHENNEGLALECMRFGFSDAVMVSAAQNIGLQDLKERILEELALKAKACETAPVSLSLISSDSFTDDDADEDIIDLQEDDNDKNVRVAVLGRPNSGKSTFVNALLNEDRVMVSDMPGTTVDAIDTDLVYAGTDIRLIDTAGIRRQRSIFEEVEKMAVARALCALDRAQVAVLMISAQEGITEQDQKIAGMIFEKKKACIIVINKWDEETALEGSKQKLMQSIEFNLSFLSYAPIVFISAKYGQKIFDVMDRALMLAPRFKRLINTSKLNRSLERAVEAHPPPMVMGKRLKFYFATQIDHSPPTFAISCSLPNEIHFSYKRYLSNFFRGNLDLAEVPIRLLFRKKSNGEAFTRESSP